MRRLIERVRRWEREFHDSFTGEIVSERDRLRSRRYVAWIDHGILRALWHNFHEVAPGVFRSNHPDHVRLERYAARAIRTVLSLRGAQTKAFHRLEVESCAALDLDLHVIGMGSREAPRREALLDLLDFFDTAPRPFLMHCKSGADRSSLASALYLIHAEGAPVARARAQMSPRFIHFRWTETGVLDEVLDLYEARQGAGPISLREWIETEYDAEAVTQSFAQRFRRRGRRGAGAAPEARDP
jgi:hypothetical protein